MAAGGGVDAASGYGLVQADAALARLPPAAPQLTVRPASIAPGATATLSWSSVNASGCTASGSWSGAQPAAGSQRETPAAAGTYTYALACANGAGASAPGSATLTVAAAMAAGASGGGPDLQSLAALAALWGLRRAARGRGSKDTGRGSNRLSDPP
jgi:hypothetical protein